MTWNNRIFRHPYTNPISGDPAFTYAMHEAYYDKNGKPESWTSIAVSEHRDSPKELIEHLEQLLKDAKRSKKDILDYEKTP